MESPRLRLVPISDSHLPGFHRIWSNADATRWSSRGLCKTLEESKQWMSGIQSDLNPEGLNYAVFIRPETHPTQNKEKGLEEGDMIGVLGVYRPVPVAELGYTFHPSAWGRGYATEAVRVFIEKFWELRPAVRKVVARCDAENVGSVRVLQKSGFREIGRTSEKVTLPAMGTGMREVVDFEITPP
ncbi:GNAT domain-containing protein [Talaromyces proteolyticus]|uniref:GNAT domain-containing protein n=1 Tax=Talaromyces proteolyticus TaxID=1131652 RepID=A0AAD4KNV1_9EURO|nr:GNAT domain-containing protein [Talaromyces proteolyticus]KAH8696144.1 GNAT domain-containing protein [Talaromyces proteolyticus]